MVTDFEQKYRAFLNTNDNTELMRTAYAAFTSVHNQQLELDPRSIWNVFDEFLSVMPWAIQLENLGYSWYTFLTTDEYRIGSVTMVPAKTGLDLGCHTVTNQDSPINETTYFPVIFQRNYTNVFQNISYDDGPWVTTVTQENTFRTMIQVSAVSTGSASNALAATATMSLNTTGIIMCGVLALAEDSMKNSTAFMEVMRSNDTNVQAYTEMINKYETVDIFGEHVKTDSSQYRVVMASIYNFIFHLPTERKKQVLDYLAYCYIDNFTTVVSTKHSNETNSLITSTTSTPFKMDNYDPVKASFFSVMLSFGNLTNYITFQTVTSGSHISLVESTGTGYQVAWVPTSFLGEGSVSDQAHTVINIGNF
ncbi:unnamed protein product [Ambrosiozyma monospora]|uniref:Unnamed protein product n=1 Tax=Ambrosiozyma monospora TaxID=43982 RepID=A0ACB5TFH8_AMBMO|nr:unnamed protein product [Ambrosiozyma monospora]